MYVFQRNLFTLKLGMLYIRGIFILLIYYVILQDLQLFNLNKYWENRPVKILNRFTAKDSFLLRSSYNIVHSKCTDTYYCWLLRRHSAVCLKIMGTTKNIFFDQISNINIIHFYLLSPRVLCTFWYMVACWVLFDFFVNYWEIRSKDYWSL